MAISSSQGRSPWLLKSPAGQCAGAELEDDGVGPFDPTFIDADKVRAPRPSAAIVTSHDHERIAGGFFQQAPPHSPRRAARAPTPR
jgi:hypothetical protein